MRTIMPSHPETCLVSSEGHCQCWYDSLPCCKCVTELATSIDEGYDEEMEVWQRAAGAMCSGCRNGEARIAPREPHIKAWEHPGIDGGRVDLICQASAIWEERTKNFRPWQDSERRLKYGPA